MARVCAVCSHPRCREIEAALGSGSFRTVAAAFGVDKSALSRHMKHAASLEAVEVLNPVSNFPPPKAAVRTVAAAAEPSASKSSAAPSTLSLDQQIRRAVLLRDRGVVPSAIASNLGINEKTLAGWFAQHRKTGVSELQAQTREGFVADLRASQADLMADLLRMHDAARERGDLRTMLEIIRERRQLLRETRETIREMGAFNIQVPSSGDNPDDEFSLAEAAKAMVRLFTEYPAAEDELLDLEAIEAKAEAGEYDDPAQKTDHLH